MITSKGTVTFQCDNHHCDASVAVNFGRRTSVPTDTEAIALAISKARAEGWWLFLYHGSKSRGLCVKCRETVAPSVAPNVEIKP